MKDEVKLSRTEFQEFFGDGAGLDARKGYEDDIYEEERACLTKQQVIYPKMAKNSENQWLYVVNAEDYAQVVVTEVCQ